MTFSRKPWLCIVVLSVSLLVVSDGNAIAKKWEFVPFVWVTDVTGPYAPVLSPGIRAFQYATEYINRELGGIRGVPIKFIYKDTGGKTDEAVSAYTKIREMNPRPPLICLNVSGHVEALRERITEDKIAELGVISMESIYPLGYTFGWCPLYVDDFGAFLDWVAENRKGKEKPRVAILTWDSAYGRAIMTEEAYDYAEKIGIDIVAKEVFGLRDVDVSSQLLRIRSKKPDWIYTNTTGAAPSIMAKSAQQMGYEVNFAGDNGIDATSVYIGKDLMENWVAAMPIASYGDKESAGMKTLLSYYDKHGGLAPKDAGVMVPLAWAMLFTLKEVVGRIVDSRGWDSLNGSAVKNQLEKLSNFTAQGIVNYDFTPTRHTPNKTMIMKIKNGQLVPITGWRTCPDLRPAKYK